MCRDVESRDRWDLRHGFRPAGRVSGSTDRALRRVFRNASPQTRVARRRSRRILGGIPEGSAFVTHTGAKPFSSRLSRLQNRHPRGVRSSHQNSGTRSRRSVLARSMTEVSVSALIASSSLLVASAGKKREIQRFHADGLRDPRLPWRLPRTSRDLPHNAMWEMTRLRLSVSSSIAYLGPSRPTPESFDPPYGI